MTTNVRMNTDQPAKTTTEAHNITGNPMLEVLRRSALIFAFWFVGMMTLGFIYNEVVVNDYTKRITSEEAPQTGDATDALPDPNYERLRLETHQIVSIAASTAFTVVLARMTLEWICYFFGDVTCGIISGQTMMSKRVLPPSFAQGTETQPQNTDNQPIQQPAAVAHDQGPPQPPTSTSIPQQPARALTTPPHLPNTPSNRSY